jgi:hypothetical protein
VQTVPPKQDLWPPYMERVEVMSGSQLNGARSVNKVGGRARGPRGPQLE